MSIDDAIRRAADALQSAETIGTLGHVSPDGDALGSALALALAARRAGKTAVASFGEPFVVPANLRFLPAEPLVHPADFPTQADVVVAFDTASADRLGSLGPAAETAATFVVADHHVSNDGFGDIAIVDPASAASGELAYRLIRAAGWEIDGDVARCIYTALVADTGRFQYSATTPATLRMAAELMEIGVRPEEVGQHLYEEVPFGYLALASRVLGRAELDEQRSLVWSVVQLADLAATGVGYEAADGLIDDLRVAREADVALLLKEVDGGMKGSLRSRGRVDVGAIAVALGGGGHRNAAGFTVDAAVDDVVGAVTAHLDA